jgi:beta-lactam-binding protein with PASTA domain/serine/threonine protein kinase
VARVGDEALVGRILDGRYLIGERIARGGMASVYMANDRRLDRTVAVKVMHQDLGDETDFLERFNREAKAAARLNHRGVVAVFDQGQDRDVTYLVMEYVPGQTLRDVMRAEAPMTPERSLGILADVLVALSAAHAAGIVHRDIKPENVLITPDGDVKVADFGLARAVSNATTAPGGPLIGTVSYIAPEIVTGEGSDTRSDVYACGAMLFEMLTGSKPHGGDSPIQIAYKHVHEDVAAPSSVQIGIPPYVDALVARATARDRNERPEDARALLRMVRRVQRAVDQGLTDDPKLTEELTPPPYLEPGNLPDEAMIAVTVPTTPITLDKAATDENLAGAPIPPLFPTEPAVPGEPTVAWTTGAPPQRGVVPAMTTEKYLEDRDGVEDDPRGRYLLIAAVAAAALVGLVGWYLGFGRYDDAPLLVGMSESEAVDSAQADGFVLKVSERDFSETAARGTIISTDPEAGANILPGATIEVIISKGKERYAVPDLGGLKASQAVSALKARHLLIGDVSEEYSDDVAKGRIKEMSGVEAGDLVKRDTRVNIVVSKGPEPINVPNFTGQSSGTATSGLRGRGFLVRIVTDYSDRVDKGRVISQFPSGGIRYRGDTITITVSNGPENIEVPNVVGKSVDSAKDKLEDAGFKVSTSGSGTVDHQSPGGGDDAKRGSTIKITASEDDEEEDTP